MHPTRRPSPGSPPCTDPAPPAVPTLRRQVALCFQLASHISLLDLVVGLFSEWRLQELLFWGFISGCYLWLREPVVLRPQLGISKCPTRLHSELLSLEINCKVGHLCGSSRQQSANYGEISVPLLLYLRRPLPPAGKRPHEPSVVSPSYWPLRAHEHAALARLVVPSVQMGLIWIWGCDSAQR